MTESKYLEFFSSGWTGKTEVYDVLSKHQGYVLGHIKWYGSWRQYCFFPSPNCVFNPDCLKTLCEFIKELMAERRRVKATRFPELVQK